MKKLMILGAGEAQLPLIETALEVGYFVVVCDARSEIKGAQLASKHYKVDYMNREKLLEIARYEKIDGIISNSEPAMLNVAWISERLNLIGNSESTVAMLLSKGQFRKFQAKIGVYAPKSFIISNLDELIQKTKLLEYPIIIKPTKSSGSRGTTCVKAFDLEVIRNAYEDCKKFSRDDCVTVEEFVEPQNPWQINDNDIFVVNGEILWDGWFWEYRSKSIPMYGMMEVVPIGISEAEKERIKHTVSKIIKESGIKHGQYDVETFFNQHGEVFVIEINPRQGGNRVPELLKQGTGIDYYKLLVTTAVGDLDYYDEIKNTQRNQKYVAIQCISSHANGVYKGIIISKEIEPYVKYIDMNIEVGSYVSKGANCGEIIGYVNLEFDSYEVQHKFIDNIEEFIYISVEEN